MLTKRGRSEVLVLDIFPRNVLQEEGSHEQASVAFNDRPDSSSARQRRLLVRAIDTSQRHLFVPHDFSDLLFLTRATQKTRTNSLVP